jgi:hypothetical protein
MPVLFEQSPADAARDEEPDWSQTIAAAPAAVRLWLKLTSIVERLSAFDAQCLNRY